MFQNMETRIPVRNVAFVLVFAGSKRRTLTLFPSPLTVTSLDLQRDSIDHKLEAELDKHRCENEPDGSHADTVAPGNRVPEVEDEAMTTHNDVGHARDDDRRELVVHGHGGARRPHPALQFELVFCGRGEALQPPEEVVALHHSRAGILILVRTFMFRISVLLKRYSCRCLHERRATKTHVPHDDLFETGENDAQHDSGRVFDDACRRIKEARPS